MAEAQARYDASEPAAFFDEDELDFPEMTEEQAEEQAREELLSTPAAVADALAVIVDPEWSPTSHPREFPGRSVHDVAALCYRLNECITNPSSLQTHELLAVAICGDSINALDALDELCDRIAHELRDEIKSRAAEIFKEAQL
jgi:hypothetical protein